MKTDCIGKTKLILLTILSCQNDILSLWYNEKPKSMILIVPKVDYPILVK